MNQSFLFGCPFAPMGLCLELFFIGRGSITFHRLSILPTSLRDYATRRNPVGVTGWIGRRWSIAEPLPTKTKLIIDKTKKKIIFAAKFPNQKQ